MINILKIVSVCILFLALLISIYLNFELSFKLNHCNDNMFLIGQDLNVLSEILKSKNTDTLNMEQQSDSLNLKYNIDSHSKILRLQLLTISINDQGRIIEISQ